ncbi:MAG: gliding motility-associated-like protein, partial [Saprospiraceae bacterium]
DYAFAQSMIEGRMGCDVAFAPAGTDPLDFRAGSVAGGCFQILPPGYDQLQQFYPTVYGAIAGPDILGYNDVISGDNFVTACLSKALYDMTSFTFWKYRDCWDPINFFVNAADQYAAEELLAFSYHDGSEGSRPILSQVFETSRAGYLADANIATTIAGLGGSPGLEYAERMRNNLIQLGNNWTIPGGPGLGTVGAQTNWPGTNPAKPAHYEYFDCYKDDICFSDITSYVAEATEIFHLGARTVDMNKIREVYDATLIKIGQYTLDPSGSEQYWDCVANTDPFCNIQKPCDSVLLTRNVMDTIPFGCIPYTFVGPVMDEIILQLPYYNAQFGYNQTYGHNPLCPEVQNASKVKATMTLVESQGSNCIKDDIQANITIDFCGTAPFAATVDGPNSTMYNFTNILTNPHTFSVPDTGSYYLKQISDASSLSTTCSSVNVTVVDEFVGAQAQWIDCNSVQCDRSSWSLGIEISGRGPWDITYIDNVGATVSETVTTSPMIFNAAPDSGTYVLTSVSIAGCNNLLNDTLSFSCSTDSCVSPTAVLSGGGTFCNGDSTQLTINFTGSPPYTAYWSEGTNSYDVTTSSNPYQFYVTSAGAYVLDSLRSDTCVGTVLGQAEVIVLQTPSLNLGADTFACVGPVVLNANALNTTTYEWLDGSTSTSLSVDTSGIYWLAVSNGSCSDTDSVTVTIGGNLELDLGADTTVCSTNLPITLTGDSGYDTYSWKNITGSEISNLIGVQILAAGVYSLEVSLNGCLGIDTIEILVNTSPVADLGSDSLTVCLASLPVIFDAQVAGATYLWQDLSTSSTFTATGSGDYWVTVEVNGCTDVDTVNLQVGTEIAINLGPDLTVCPSATSSFSTGLGTGFTHDWNNGQSVANNYSLIGAGQLTVMVSDASGCEGFDTVNVVVANPLAVSLGPDSTICEGDPDVVMTMVSGRTDVTVLSWNSDLSLNSNSYSSNTAGLYWINVDSAGCVASDTMQLFKNSLPVVDLGPDTFYCAGTASQIVLSGPLGMADYEWSTAETSSSITVTNSSTVSIKVIDGNSCVGRDTIVISEESATIFDLGKDTTICPGGSASINVPASVITFNYGWTGGGQENPFVVSNQTDGNTVLVKLVVANDFGCLSADSLIVNVENDLNISLGDSAVCEGEDVVFTSLLSAQYHAFEWNGNPVNNQSSFSITNANAIQLVTLSVVSDEGCYGTKTVTLVVNEKPDVQISDTSFCEGDKVTVGHGLQNVTTVWGPIGKGGNSISINSPGSYSAQVTSANKCVETVSFNVTQNDTLILLPIQNIELCEGESVVLDPNIDENLYTVVWDGNVVANSISVSEEGEHTYLVQEISSNCTSTSMYNVNVNLIETVDLGNDTTICEGTKVEIKSNTNNAVKWNDGSRGKSVIIESTKLVSIQVGTEDCFSADTVLVTVIERPIISLPADTVVCFDDVESINIKLSNAYTVYDFNSYEPGGHSGVINTAGEYNLVVSNRFCEAEQTINVINDCPASVWVPNSFSPNEDGINDQWKIAGISVEDLKLHVYNRWGELIWVGDHVGDFWDGTYMGSDAQIDVYVWTLSYSYLNKTGESTPRSSTGHVSLIR